MRTSGQRILITGGGSGIGLYSDLVEVTVQVRGILLDAIGPGSLEFIGAVTAREQSDAEGVDAAGGQEIPHAVSHHDGIRYLDPRTLGRGQKQIGIGFRPFHLISRDDRNVRGDIEHLQHRSRALHVPTGRDRPRHFELREVCK
jgi:hypothetical protein